MIIWLASYPRSGNTLLRIILNAAFDRRSHSKHDDVRDIGADPSTAAAVGHAPLAAPWDAAYPALRDAPEPFFVKTHDAPEDDAKAIYVVRDGRRASISFHHYLKDFGTGAFDPDIADVILGFTPFGSWGSHLDQWQPHRRPNTLLLKYEDIVADPGLAIRRIADFTGLPAVRTWENNFDELHRLNPKFFRAGPAPDATPALSPDDEELFWLHHADWMRDLGYDAPRPVHGSLLPLRSRLSTRGTQFFESLARTQSLQSENAAAYDKVNTVRAELWQSNADLTAARTQVNYLAAARAQVTHLTEALAEAAARSTTLVTQALDLESRYEALQAHHAAVRNDLHRSNSLIDAYRLSRAYRILQPLKIIPPLQAGFSPSTQEAVPLTSPLSAACTQLATLCTNALHEQP